MESVKSIVKDVVYGKSKIHTNMEFTFSNNKGKKTFKKVLTNIPALWYHTIRCPTKDHLIKTVEI